MFTSDLDSDLGAGMPDSIPSESPEQVRARSKPYRGYRQGRAADLHFPDGAP
jgi:hypothetical protein